ncbi:MAG: NADH-quinone oxidoreductase subunit C [Anaerolineae bacterium]|nr:NADH-quinone oxidoreductase subunit C [Anaerolineae bacterium]
MQLKDPVASLRAELPGAVLDVIEALDETTVVTDRASLPHVLAFLRDTPGLQYNFLVDITGVDYLGYTPPAPERFAVCYHLLAMLSNRVLRVKVYVPEADPVMPSILAQWPAANWPEREIQDMLGLDFAGHPDKRRLLMPQDWDGHPLRKDYPLGYETVQFSFNWQEIDAKKPYAKE